MPRLKHSPFKSSSLPFQLFFGDPADFELIKLYCLRILTTLGAHKTFIDQDSMHEISFYNDTIANLIGLDQTLENEIDSGQDKVFTSRRQALAAIHTLHQAAESQADKIVPNKALRNNSLLLSRITGLTDTERHILEFAVLLHTNSILEQATDHISELSHNQLSLALSALLNRPIKSVQKALSNNGKLQETGLLKVDSNSHVMAGKISLLSNKFAERMCCDETNPIELLKDQIHSCVPSTLKFKDFRHISDNLEVLRPYLKHALKDQRQGVNIFIYGKPGVGKTELARLLAQDCGAPLYEVSCENEDGNVLGANSRLSAFQASQAILKDQKALLLFDEIEDIFGGYLGSVDNYFSRFEEQTNSKAWINRTLENNDVPTIWLSNNKDCLDPAFIRRFDLTFELPVPPRRQREDMLRKHCNGLLDNTSITRMAESEQLSPAIVTRATAVVRSIQPELVTTLTSSALEQLINNTLIAQGHKEIPFSKPSVLPHCYSLDLVNTESNLHGIAEGIRTSGNASLCFYGPSGTGKTAYAHWLAHYLDTPLHVRKSSDLLSKYVGEMEQNLAHAFREAEQNQAILLLDEVDSFLQDRREAKQTWEISQVNELLTQMDSFPGIFIATTNMMNQLDQAALRRFDMKLMFDYLTPQQAWQLYCAYSRALDLKKPGAIQKQSLSSLDVLTPGDFALISRPHRLNPIESHSRFIQCLEEECAMKEVGGKRAIGFI